MPWSGVVRGLLARFSETPNVPLPGLRDWMFSLKTFAGAMLAVWIALRLDLDRPYWAMATAYIVAQPLAGAMRSKALYRFIGTFVGSVVTLILLPNLIDAPELLVAALCLWIGGCIYFAVLDRSPRSYVFLLAGYSVALIGFPSVDAPGGIWDIVVARVEEITIGIACATLVGILVFPVALGPALSRRIDSWTRNAAALAVAVLSNSDEAARMTAARRRVAGDSVEIGMLASHLAFDTSNMQSATRPMTMLQRRVLLLLPAISAIDDRLIAMRAENGVPPALQGVMDRIAAWIGAFEKARIEDASGLQDDIAAIDPQIDASSSWNDILISGVLLRLRELVDLVHDIESLRRHIEAGRTRLPKMFLAAADTSVPGQHRDHLLALHSAFATVVTIGLICAFWIGTAWPEGSLAAALGGTGCAFFAAQDDPAPSLVGFIYALLIAVVLDAILLFALLPMAHDFEMVVLVMAPPFLIMGVMMSMPAAARLIGPIPFLAATQLALSNSYSADFASYVNGSIASVVGLAMTVAIIRVIRSLGAEWAAERLLHFNRLDVGRLAATSDLPDRLPFIALMMDRLSLVAPRLAAVGEGADGTAVSAMRDLRVGVNIVDLRHEAVALSPAAQHAVDAMLRDVSLHYLAAGRPAAPEALLGQIDGAIAEVTHCPEADLRGPLLQLVGIRRALFPDGAPYRPAPRPAPVPSSQQEAA